MGRMKKLLSAAGLVLLAAFAGGLVAANQGARTGPPTRVATVNLGTLVDKLQEKAEWEIKLRNLQSQIMEEIRVRKTKLDELVAQVNAMQDPAKKMTSLEEAQLQKLELDQWATMKERELDREASLMWRQIYKHIREEAGKLAESKGYDYVIVAEPGDDIQLGGDSRVPATQRALEQIGRRRLLYTSPAHDITEELGTRMNNAYAVGR